MKRILILAALALPLGASGALAGHEDRGYWQERGYGHGDRGGYGHGDRGGYGERGEWRGSRHHGYGHGDRCEDMGRHGGHGRHHAKDGGGHGMGEGRHGKRHGRRGMARNFEMIERFDADGDGMVSQQEVDTWRSDRLKQFDTDGDGSLTLQEYEALWLDAMRKRMVDRFQRHDDDGDGRITADEFGSRSRHMVMMRDRDGDGAFGPGDFSRRGGEEWREMPENEREAVREASEPGPAGDVPEPSEETEDLLDGPEGDDPESDDPEADGQEDSESGN